MRGGINSYIYVGANPLFWIDPLGLAVELCKAPADIVGGLVDHWWIKTSTKEVGVAGTKDNPGEEYEAPYLTKIQWADHRGASKNRKGASCEKVDHVDEDKVNELLQIGKPLGHFSLVNNCQTNASRVLSQSWKGPLIQVPNPVPNFPDIYP